MKAITYAGLATSVGKENKNTIEYLFKTIEEIIEVSKNDIKSRNRLRKFVDARKIISLFCIRNLQMSTTDTGDLINRDHSSICHYTRDIEGMLKYDIQLKSKYDKVIKRMHDKNLINYGAETVRTYLDRLEADKLDKETTERLKAGRGYYRRN